MCTRCFQGAAVHCNLCVVHAVLSRQTHRTGSSARSKPGAISRVSRRRERHRRRVVARDTGLFQTKCQLTSAGGVEVRYGQSAANLVQFRYWGLGGSVNYEQFLSSKLPRLLGNVNYEQFLSSKLPRLLGNNANASRISC